MLFLILGVVDVLGGAILFFSSHGLVSTIGAALAIKGLWSLASDALYLMRGEG